MPGDDVASYLERVREAPAREIDETIADLERRRDALAAREPNDRLRAALADLSLKRLLASTTLLMPNSDDRLGWDAANRLLYERIEREPWSVAQLAALNAILSKGGAFRDGPIYSPPDEYLDAARAIPELEKLERFVASGAHPLHTAAAVYISVVTIHPFTNGNGRTARLGADRVLLEHGFLPLCFLSPIAAHVAQMQGGPPRSPLLALRRVLNAVEESYATVARHSNS
jgi:hypothetical protein